MTTHAAAYETIAARHPGASGLRPDQMFSLLMTNIDFTGDEAYLLPYPLVPPSGYSQVPCSELTIIENGDTHIYTKAFGNLSQVIQDGARVDNSDQFVQPGTGFISAFNSGRLGPRMRLIFAGSSVHPANITALSGLMQYGFFGNTYSGFQHFCEFEEFPPNSSVDPDAAVTALLNAFNQSTSQYQVGLDSGGLPINMNNCGFAALAPEGAIFVRPEDIGNGADQIPQDTVNNTGAKFRAHPSVFYPAGKATFVRGVTRQKVDIIEVNSQVPQANGGPIGITTVDSAPTATNWLVSVDGQMAIYRLNHPVGSDYRRPRDIWNNVWVPILQGSSDVGSATLFDNPFADGGSAAFRWDYADYFRCLPIPGTNVFQDIPG